MRAIVAIVLIALFLVIALLIVKTMMDRADETARRDACRKSIQLSAIKLDGLADEFGNPVDIKCSTEYLNFNSQDDARLKKEIADQMVECWDTFGKGEKEIFDTKDNSYCVVCSRLSFDKKAELPEFSGFLNSNMAPLKKKTYMEYLTGVKIENFQKTVYENTNLSRFDTISTKEPLAVMFVMGKNANPGAWTGIEATKTESTLFGVAGGTAIGATAGVIISVGLAACPETAGIGCAVAFIAGLVGTVTTGAVVGGTVGGAAGGTVGFMAGSDRSADWDARIVLWPYDRLDEMQCTYMEGKSGKLEIKEVG